MSTVVATLPKGSDPAEWSPEEKALVEAAGLVAVDARSGAKTAAPRPVVAAFLQHCRRTGLDPFARQIYCLARKSKGEYRWTTQISIDGARLVAERSGQYEGQTTPEFTADGVTWTQVWLQDEPPKAARVGVYRRGFREPLYAIALWSAYAVYQDEWANGSKTGKQVLSAMWQKMGPLMLAKCAEMLALRKAFPQDLSGLYSTEEMDQAGGVREVVQQVERPAVPQGVDPVSGVVDAEVVEDAPAEPRKPSRDWGALAEAITDPARLTELAELAQQEGELGLVVGLAGDNDDGSAHTVMDVLRARKAELERPVALVPEPAKPKQRRWVQDARRMTSRADVGALIQEAIAAGALAQVIEELEAIARTLPEDPQPVASWAVAEVPADGEWAEGAPAGEES